MQIQGNYPRVIHNRRSSLIFPSVADDYPPRYADCMNLLEVTKLVKSYSGRTVVNDVSFLLRQREVVGLLGRNGAGKTTTFRMILGMVEPDSGAVAFDAVDITFLPMFKRARLGIGYLSQERSDFRRLSVLQNLLAILETLNLTRRQRIHAGRGSARSIRPHPPAESESRHPQRRRTAETRNRPRPGHRSQAHSAR